MEISVKGALQLKDSSGKVEFSQILDAIFEVNESDVRKIKIAAAAIDAIIDFGGVSDVTFLAIISDQDVSVKLNSSVTDSSVGKLFMFSGSSGGFITDLSISNPGSSEANVRLILG